MILLVQVWHSEHARPDGGAMQPYLNMVCKRLHRSLQIMVESMQVCVILHLALEVFSLLSLTLYSPFVIYLGRFGLVCAWLGPA